MKTSFRCKHCGAYDGEHQAHTMACPLYVKKNGKGKPFTPFCLDQFYEADNDMTTARIYGGFEI